MNIAHIAPEWDELAERVGAPPWLRPGWMEAWWRAFGRGLDEVVAIRRAGELSAIVPLARRGGALHSLSNWHSPSFGLLAADDDARTALADALFARDARSVRLAFLPDDAAGLGACLDAAVGRGYPVILRTLERSPFLPIDGEWAAYERSLDPRLRQDLRRRRRRLEEQGDVTVEVLDGAERLDVLLEEGFRVEAAGWKGERRTAIASSPATRTFYTTVACWAAERGWLRLCFLRLDGRGIAFNYSLEHGSRHYLLKTGFDAAYEKYAPGKLLLREMLERAFALGLASYEFLGDDAPWKLEWTGTVRERRLFHAFARSTTGRAEWAAWRYGRPLVKRTLAALPLR